MKYLILILMCLITTGCYHEADDQEYLKTVYPDKVIYRAIGTIEIYAVCDSSGKLCRLVQASSIITAPKIYDIKRINSK